MSNKVKIHQFDPVIYPYKIWITLCSDTKVIKERFYLPDKTEITYEVTDTYDAFTDNLRLKENNLMGVLICFKNKKAFTTKIIAHESAHAAKMLFEYIGADIKPMEPFEYLVGWIADCCEQVKLNKFK